MIWICSSWHRDMLWVAFKIHPNIAIQKFFRTYFLWYGWPPPLQGYKYWWWSLQALQARWYAHGCSLGGVQMTIEWPRGVCRCIHPGYLRGFLTIEDNWGLSRNIKEIRENQGLSRIIEDHISSIAYFSPAVWVWQGQNYVCSWCPCH